MEIFSCLGTSSHQVHLINCIPQILIFIHIWAAAHKTCPWWWRTGQKYLVVAVYKDNLHMSFVSCVIFTVFYPCCHRWKCEANLLFHIYVLDRPKQNQREWFLGCTPSVSKSIGPSKQCSSQAHIILSMKPTIPLALEWKGRLTDAGNDNTWQL